MFQGAEASGSAHMNLLAQVGARRVDNLARHRDVLQRLNVNRHWPAQYVLQAPLWNHKEQKEEQGDIVMWLSDLPRWPTLLSGLKLGKSF